MAAREDMYRVPVDVESLTLQVNLDLIDDEVAIGGVRSDGTRILYKTIDDGTGKGLFPVVFIPDSTIVGTTVTTFADVSVAPGATVPLPTIPSGTIRMTVQNTGPANSLIRVRSIGDPPASGFILPRFSSKEYGGVGGSIDALEVQEIAGIPTSVCVQFERI